MTSQPSSPMEMSYTQLVEQAARPKTPAVTTTTNQTKPPATIDVYRRRSSSSSTLFSNPSAKPSSHTVANSSDHQATSVTVEDRLSNLALKLQPNSSTNQCDPQPQPSSNTHLHEVHHFIEILRNMQNVVSTTADEQQREKKARALNTLLTMFESIIDERNIFGSSKESSATHLQWRINCLEMENQRLQSRCIDRENALYHRNQEIGLLQQDVQQMASENDKLKIDLAHAQEQSQQEYIRAQEAEQVASESEKVRDGMLSSYGRLTEENVDLLRAMEDVESEKEVIREEVDALRNQSNQLHKQLRDSSKRKKELENLLDAANNAIFSANEDRKRLQEELYRSQSSNVQTSEQLMKLRDEFAKKLQVDRNSKAHASLATRLEEEQTRRKQLEDEVSMAKGKEDSATVLMRNLARSNAELRSQLNQMVARINQSPCESDEVCHECPKEVKNLLDDTNLSDNLSCYF